VERYRSLSPKDIQNVAQAFLEQEPTIAVISPYEVDRVKEAVSAAK
jgi:predicted Zn-dependent peptidase